jgi:hypothetical protein
VVKVKPGLNPVIPGFASFVFAVPIICRVYGEQSLYFNVKDHGLVSVTGCCHQSIIQFAETAYREIKYEKDQLYGIYGGLHISPFEDWDPKYDDLVISLGKYGFQKRSAATTAPAFCAPRSSWRPATRSSRARQNFVPRRRSTSATGTRSASESKGVTYYTLESRVEKCEHSPAAVGTVRIFAIGWKNGKIVKFIWGGPKGGKVEY